ncbi:LuxR C-terminal-related transcriptional regulator [Nonomuraea sp. K271]|uniref:LuxR C-terminal-related transcriptional regulator n=1 Tax=Nonomuraea sp. K271 TaxID=1848319 RepID=UPI003FA6056A
MSPGTVKAHIGRLLTKLNARHRAQLVIAAYEARLVRRVSRPRVERDQQRHLDTPTVRRGTPPRGRRRRWWRPRRPPPRRPWRPPP